MKTFTQRLVESSADYLKEEYRQQLIAKLTNAFMEEINAFYQYFIVREYLVGINRKCVEEFFEEAGKDELYDHAAYLLKRIAQLGGMPVDALNLANVPTMAKHPYMAPGYLAKSTMANDDNSDKVNYVVDVVTAVNQNIDAEKGAIETYRDIAEFTQNIDIVTHREIKRILEDEIEHLQELLDLQADLESLNPCPCKISEPCKCPDCEPACACDDCCCDKSCDCDEPSLSTELNNAVNDLSDIFNDTL